MPVAHRRIVRENENCLSKIVPLWFKIDEYDTVLQKPPTWYLIKTNNGLCYFLLFYAKLYTVLHCFQ